MKLSRTFLIAIVAATFSVSADEQRPSSSPQGTPAAKPAATQKTNAHAAILEDFKARISKYMDLRKDAVKGSPQLKETEDPAQIKAAQDSMAARIRSARAGAKQGDIFTPEIAAHFRRLLSPELKGEEGRDTKQVLKDDAPTNVPFKVNAKYPEGAPLPTVPSNLLLSLPMLPEPLQYRVIGKHVILLDADADVIVDYALNVIR
jgi:hypothetical protein